jgi:lipid II:glycine glycyltransferase (peptidoglycan interpeptide bridge formation enzyme)
MKDYGTLFVAEYNGELLTGTLFLEDDGIMSAWKSGSKRLNATKEKAKLIGWASRLLYWEAIKYAKMHDIEEFNIGGLFSENDKVIISNEEKKGINFFKMSFGGKVVEYYHYNKHYSIIYNNCVKLFLQTTRFRNKLSGVLVFIFDHWYPAKTR